MPRFPQQITLLVAALAGALLQTEALACSSCGCTVSSDWETLGLTSRAGLRLDLRYDYINQKQMRHGTGKASQAQIDAALAASDINEIEQYTRNQYVTLGADYTFNRDWGLNVQLPWIDRKHATLPDGMAPADTSSDSSIGDIRVLGRYQGLDSVGLMFGIKLPTGKTDVRFASGDALDRSLQPGSGSTDALLGLYRLGTLNRDWDWYVQAIGQAVLSTKSGYRPGNSLNLNGGLRYMELGALAPQVQLNYRWVHSDKQDGVVDGNTGGEVLYLSPGATYAIGKSTKVYAFVQLPLYQYAKGYQLAPYWTASAGVNLGF
ncbi:MAG: hypothetical protein WBX11_02205 [Thiobacillaceae bacterium]